MIRLDISGRAQVVRCLVEGNSVRSTVRMTAVAKNTIVKLLGELGSVCIENHNRTIRNLRVRRLQCDDIRTFAGTKKQHTIERQMPERWGDVWTWTAIDADTKLCVSWLVGGRDAGWALEFMKDCAARINGQVQVATGANRTYLEAVEGALATGIDYGQLCAIYGAPSERHRLTSAATRKVDNHCHAVALYFAYYNFCRVRQTFRVTPAMEAGVADHVWSVEELVHLHGISN
jgi:hypothetical protein